MSLTPEPGISRALARDRAGRVSDVRYRIELELAGQLDAPIRGEVDLIDLSDRRTPLALDFAPNAAGRLTWCICNGHTVPHDIVNGHIVLPPEVLEARNSVHLAFVAGDGPLNRRDGYLYTIFVPARAHESFPCFDQPDLKGRFTLALTIPDAWTAVANGPEIAGEAVGAARQPGRRTVHFAETQPISTYLFAFAAGEFSVEIREVAGSAFRVLHRSQDAEVVGHSVDTIADAHARALVWLTEYTAIPYPFSKLDVVLVPAFQFGGMEHPGAIFYNANTLLPGHSATRQQLLARAHVIAHETAHMWFGNLVTMTWFDDVWMKEVFANLMAAKIVNPQFPDLEHDLRFLHSHHAAAYDVDRTAGTNPIRQPLDNLLDAGSLYGPIVYLKSAIVMRQLERALGETTLRHVLRQYLEHFRFSTASWPDLLALMAPHAPFDAASWSRAWIDEPGRPVVQADIVSAGAKDGTRIDRLTLRQLDPDPGRRLTWSQPVDVALGYDTETVILPATLDGPVRCIDEAAGRPWPDYVLASGRGSGYAFFDLDERSRDWLMGHLPRVEDPLTRAAAWLTLWDAMLHGRVTASALADLATRLIRSERNEMNLQRVLTSVERLFWICLPDRRRSEYAESLETALRSSLDSTRVATTRAAVFECFRSVATTDGALAWLQAVWSGETEPPFPLTEDDQVAIALELAVRGDGEILGRQMARTHSGDRLDRLMFLAPAVSADAEARAMFFDTLRDVGHRRREPWAIEGLSWLHHPLRASTAVPLIEPTLGLLQEVKRTGDIFFPKRWVDATLAGHRSPEAADAVRRFLQTRPPAYPPALRRIVLVAADQLLRSADGVITI